MEKLPAWEREIVTLFKKERFLDAEEKAYEYSRKDPNNAALFFYKGAANIFMSRIDDGLMDFGEALYLNPQHVPTMHGIAYVLLKKEDYAGALNKWISILEVDPKDKIAKKNTQKFKKNFPDKAALNLNPYLYIPIPKATGVKLNTPLKISLLGLAAVLFLIISFWTYRFFAGYTFKLVPDFSGLLNKEIYYTFTEKEIEFYKKEIFDLVNLQKYNQAKLLLNKFYYSNASLDDKKLAKTWESRLEYPTQEKMDINYTPEEVFTNTRIFQDCFVLWTGTVDHLTQKNKYLFLELKIQEGKSVGVSFFSNYPLIKGDKVKFLGRIAAVKENSLEVEAFTLEKQ